MTKYCISDLMIEMSAPEWALHDNLKIFQSDAEGTDIECSVVFERFVIIPVKKAKLIMNTSGTSIYEYDGFFHIYIDGEKAVPSYYTLSEDCSVCRIFVNPEFNNPGDPETVRRVVDGIFVTLRIIMMAILTQNQGFMCHSVTIIWNDRGVMFSAPSGTGKSTHTHLWQQLYGVRILDGDLTACRMINGTPVAYGLPWCGTSGEFTNRSVPLSAIVFLQQARENRIEKLVFPESFMRLAARCFQLPWNDKMANQFLDVIQEVSACTDNYLLNCLPDNDAVELVKKCLEEK